jgi:hypothetical protein
MVAIHQRPNTGEPATLHKIYPYWSAGSIEWSIGCSSQTSPTSEASGFLFLVVIMNCVSAILAPHQ